MEIILIKWESLAQAVGAGSNHLRMSVCFLVMGTVDCVGRGKMSPPGKAIFSSLTSGLCILPRQLCGVHLSVPEIVPVLQS